MRRTVVAGFTVPAPEVGKLEGLKNTSVKLNFTGEQLHPDGSPMGNFIVTSRGIEVFSQPDGSAVVGVKLGVFPMPTTTLSSYPCGRVSTWAGAASQINLDLKHLLHESLGVQTEKGHTGVIIFDEPNVTDGRRQASPELRAQLQLIYEMTSGLESRGRIQLFVHAIRAEVDRQGLKISSNEVIRLAEIANIHWSFDRAIEAIEEALNSD
jgi:hypothetical protein